MVNDLDDQRFHSAIIDAARGDRKPLVALLRRGVCPNSPQTLNLLADLIDGKIRLEPRRRGRPHVLLRDMFRTQNIQLAVAEYEELSRSWGKTREKDRKKRAISEIAKKNGISEAYLKNVLKRGKGQYPRSTLWAMDPEAHLENLVERSRGQ